MPFLPIIFSVLVLIPLLYFGYGFWIKRRKGHRGSLLGTTLFLIKLPQQEEEEGQNLEEKVGKAENLYSAFSDLKRGSFWSRFLYGSPRIAMEISNVAEQGEIAFYIAVPKGKEEESMKKIQGTYPEAEVLRQDEDYNIFQPQSKVAGAYLTLDEDIFPIKTYSDFKVDPLSQVTNSLSKLSDSEGAAVQLVLRPGAEKWKGRVKEIISELEKGKSLGEVKSRTSTFKSIIQGVYRALVLGKPPSGESDEDATADEETVKALRSKVRGANYEANVRLMASAESTSRAKEILSELSGSFNQFSSSRNKFKVNKIRRRGLPSLIRSFSLRSFKRRQKTIFSVEELATLCHLSLGELKTPGVKKSKAKKVAPPSRLPDQGEVLLGKTEYRGEEKKIFLPTREDRRRHFYLVGQTGTGKTSIFQEMIRQDIEKGEGVGVIDPHGDLVEATLANIPKGRLDDVVLFEPFHTERPCGLNMLEYDTPRQKDFAVQEMISIFHKLFPPEIIGPMFEHYMRNAMLALMADKENPGTLIEIPRIFTDEDFMHERLEKVEDPAVEDFWLKEWEQTTGKTRSDMLGYVVSKIGRFVENRMMRNIIGQRHSSFDLGKIADEGKIFIANLSKGETGEMSSSLLGLILVTKLQMAVMKRAGVPEEERKDFYLYMDEFQNFTTDSIATILSEARKYRLNLHMTHQYISQLEDEIREAVFGNVGSMAALRVGAEDADVLEAQFEPQFSKGDLANLPNYEAILKMVANGEITDPFRMETYIPQEGNEEMVPELKEMSHLKYGRPREEVERKVEKRLREGAK